MKELLLILNQLKDEEGRKRIITIILIPIIFLIIIFIAAGTIFQTQSGTAGSSLSDKVEEWRPLVRQYCEEYEIAEYTDLALALMQAESAGNEPDPMQAAEGAYGLYCLQTNDNSGGHIKEPGGIPSGHAECSINAGVQELRDALNKADVESPYDIDHIKVAIQGYNYGMDGWIRWIKQHGGKYTLELSQEYSDTVMPDDAKGTPNHAEKVMKYYSIASGDNSAEITLLEGNSGLQVTYYNQGDAAWKSLPYGDSTIGVAGCGPTSMAICITTLTEQKVTPRQTATWAAENGYYVSGAGSSHSLIPALAKKYNLKCEGIGKNKVKIIDALCFGKLVVAIMGPGHFTSEGHFMVLTGIKDGKITVADCGSRDRTNQTWSIDLIISEARNGAGVGGPFWIISK